MTNKEKLIKFIEAKNRLVVKASGVKYIDKEDIKDINEWNNPVCKNVYKQLTKEILNGAEELYISTCIWCIKYSTHCDSCGYQERHGKCMDGGSLFQTYNTDKTQKVLTNKKYKQILQRIEKIRKR